MHPRSVCQQRCHVDGDAGATPMTTCAALHVCREQRSVTLIRESLPQVDALWALAFGGQPQEPRRWRTRERWASVLRHSFAVRKHFLPFRYLRAAGSSELSPPACVTACMAFSSRGKADALIYSLRGCP